MTESRPEHPNRPAADQLAILFARMGQGDDAALEALYRICSDELYGLALWRTGSAVDAADAVQDVFVRIVAARQRLASVKDPRAYLRRMAHSAAVDVHRRRRRRREASLDECRFLEAAESSPERRAESTRLSRLLARLPDNQREAIFLRELLGCSFAEIGRATGVPTFTAASRYRLGMRRLRSLAGVDR